MQLNRDIIPVLEDAVENAILSACFFCVFVHIYSIDKFILISRVIQSFLCQFSIEIVCILSIMLYGIEYPFG